MRKTLILVSLAVIVEFFTLELAVHALKSGPRKVRPAPTDALERYK